MRIKLTIEYNGEKFFGWQKQNGHISVQETMEKAISKVFGDIDVIELYGAGRTDTGVHATGQVAHIDIIQNELIEKWKNNIPKLSLAINFYLIGMGAIITSAEVVSNDFHARFSAKMRHYKYVIYNRKIKSVIYEKMAWHIPNKLDEVKMNQASQLMLGTHNLTSFRSAHCNSKNPTRTISKIKIYRENDFVIMEISAKSFLHNQVRIIMGTLAQIGKGKYQTEYINFLLHSKNRIFAGPTAPPHGLYLTKIEY